MDATASDLRSQRSLPRHLNGGVPMKWNKYNLTAFGIIGVVSSFLISKSGLSPYVSIPLALLLASIIAAVASRIATRRSQSLNQAADPHRSGDVN